MAHRTSSHKSKISIKKNLLIVKDKALALFADFSDIFSHFPLEKRIGVVFLAILSFVLVFFPLVVLSPIDGDAIALRFFALSFWKNTLIIVSIVGILWAWYLSPRIKQTIHQTIGFRENDFLFTFFLLLVVFAQFVGLQESITFATNATSTLSVSVGYYVVLFLLLIGLIYSLIKLLKEARVMRKTDFMGFIQSDDETGSSEEAGLFQEDLED